MASQLRSDDGSDLRNCDSNPDDSNTQPLTDDVLYQTDKMSESRQTFSDGEGLKEGQLNETLKEIQEEQETSSTSLTSREETQQEEIKEIKMVLKRPHHQGVWSISGPEMSLTTEERLSLDNLVSQQARACRDCVPNW